MWKKILIGLAAVLAGLVVLVSLQPSTYAIERSTVVAAPPARVFGQVNDLAAWDAWTPFRKLDPDQRLTLSSPSAGPGASVSWVGNEKVGEGKMTILAATAGERVELEQVFLKPLAGKALIAFTFAQESEGTKVTWRLSGENDFLGKLMCLVMDMDAMLGPDMAEGLANMKAVAEKSAQGQ